MKLRHVTFFFLLFFCFATFSYSAEMGRRIFDPYGALLVERSQGITIGSNEVPAHTALATHFSEFINQRVKSRDLVETPYCKVGGDYRSHEAYVSSDGSDHDRNFLMWHCKTTKELFDKVHVPSSWTSNRLLVYCNDGSDILDKVLNFDVFVSRIETYKACIVKNLDLAEDNTIVYAYEVGNDRPDELTKYFTDLSVGNRFAKPFLEEGVTITDKQATFSERQFIFEQDEKDHLIALYTPGAIPEIPVAGFIGLRASGSSQDDFFDNTRVLALRYLPNREPIIGYEKPVFSISKSPEEDNRAFFVIKGITQSQCGEGLAYYNPVPVTSEQEASGARVSCQEDRVFINGKLMGVNAAYALFISLISNYV